MTAPGVGAYSLLVDEHEILVSARVSHMLSVMYAQRVAELRPLPDLPVRWVGQTEDGRKVELRPWALKEKSGD